MIERCEKCGKPFMDKSEVSRHKMYEHIVPVSPFEQNKEEGATTTIFEDTNVATKGSRNRNNHPEELQKSITTTTATTSTNVDITTNKGENNDNNYTSSINVTKNRSRGFRSFRL